MNEISHTTAEGNLFTAPGLNGGPFVTTAVVPVVDVNRYSVFRSKNAVMMASNEHKNKLCGPTITTATFTLKN